VTAIKKMRPTKITLGAWFDGWGAMMLITAQSDHFVDLVAFLMVRKVNSS